MFSRLTDPGPGYPLFDNFPVTPDTSTPVILWTVAGRLAMMSSTSLVILLAPTGPSPVATMVIFLVPSMGVLTSLATSGSTCIGRILEEDNLVDEGGLRKQSGQSGQSMDYHHNHCNKPDGQNDINVQ